MAKIQYLEPVQRNGGERYEPCLTYLHFMVRRDDDNKVTQTADYVAWVYDLLATHGILQRFKRIEISGLKS